MESVPHIPHNQGGGAVLRNAEEVIQNADPRRHKSGGERTEGHEDSKRVCRSVHRKNNRKAGNVHSKRFDG